MGKKLIVSGADFSDNAIEKEKEYTLQNGYATIISTQAVELDRNESSNAIRVRTNQLHGSYYIKTKPGYVIRAIAKYSNKLNITGPGIYEVTNGSMVSNVQGLTEYTFSEDAMYSIITFSKTDATQPISPNDDIIDDMYYLAE